MRNFSAAARQLAWLLVCGLGTAPAGQAAPAPVQVQSGAALIFDGVPPLDPSLSSRIADYLRGRDASFLTWLPDNSLLVSTRFGDLSQVHRVSAPLGMREQLTWYTDPITNVSAAPAGPAGGFAFLMEHTEGLPQLYYYDFAARSAHMLSSGAFRHGSPLWSADGQHIVFTGNDRDGITTDIFISDPVAATAPRLVVAGRDRPWFPLDWSPDGQKLLLWQPGSNDQSDLYIADVHTGGAIPVAAGGPHLGLSHAHFSPGGRGIYFTSVDDGDFAHLRFLDLDSHQAVDLTATIPWDIVDFQVGVDGRYLAYVTNDSGRDRLTVLDNQQKLELSPAGLPEGRISGLHFDHTGHLLAFSAAGPQAPSDVYVYDPERNQLTRWTHSEPGPVNPQDFVPAELIQYPTFDRTKSGPRMIPAFVYRPRTPGPHPVLIDIHDGPADQFRPDFDAFIQFAVNQLGYVVIAPNIRGSTGYGKSYADLDNGPGREDALRDLGALLVWVGMQKDLVRTQVAVMGQSYGGFMALAMLATYGDRLSGGIIVDGSPSQPSYLAQVRKPVLVFQGLQDTPAQISQSGQVVATLRAQGGEAWYVMARDEAHDIRHVANRDAWLATVAQFLKKLAP